jgi:hypothetical protein
MAITDELGDAYSHRPDANKKTTPFGYCGRDGIPRSTLPTKSNAHYTPSIWKCTRVQCFPHKRDETPLHLPSVTSSTRRCPTYYGHASASGADSFMASHSPAKSQWALATLPSVITLTGGRYRMQPHECTPSPSYQALKI